MNEENKICPLLSIVDNENGYLNCKRAKLKRADANELKIVVS